ncbi:MAG: HEAT repeat domain-containing protein [Acidimicrobiia bacterium]
MEAEKLVQALAVGWGGVQLYPDPAAVPAFVTATEAIGEFAESSILLTVGVDGFSSDSELVVCSHGAAERLAQALFAWRVEALAILSPPSPHELTRFFQLVAEDSSHFDQDLPACMQAEGLTSIEVRGRDLLEERGEDQEIMSEPATERHPDVQAMFEEDSVRHMAERIMALSPAEAAAAEFVESYRRAHGQVDAGDPAGLQRVAQTFVDAFFRLEHDYRAPVFEAVLDVRDEAPFRNFLDQFSADELSELATAVDNSALPLLVEYARVVTDMQGRDPGLVKQVMGAGTTGTRRAVAGTVGIHLARFLENGNGEVDAVDSIAAEVEALNQAPREGWLVLGDLFSIEDRTERLRRLLRIWVAKLGAAIRSKDFPEAVAWLGVLNDVDIEPSLLDDAYDQVASEQVLEILTDGDAPYREVRDQLLQQMAGHAGDRVLEQLAVEEDPGRRRMLIDIVGEMARVDLNSVLPGLSDSRWYVVRNLAIALGHSGRKAAGEPLARLTRHDDHRVRIEALRALLPCVGPAAVGQLIRALADEHIRVRGASIYLLATLDDEVVIPALRDAMTDVDRPIEVRVAAIEALGRREDEESHELLEQMAQSGARLSASARALRAAAKGALRSDHA